jgi:hypothetical protein
MAQASQTYRNHVRWLPPFHFFVLPVLLVNIFVQLRPLVQAPAFSTGWAFLVAVAIFMVGLLSRVQAATVQDRVIRLEMRLRLREVLPADLKPRIHELTHGQLVALRFASDAELPELVREVLEGKLRTKKEIKMRVRDWQPDHLRA